MCRYEATLGVTALRASAESPRVREPCGRTGASAESERGKYLRPYLLALTLALEVGIKTDIAYFLLPQFESGVGCTYH